ncbi:MAG: rhodanese-like domain-containing protein [Gemmatimonadales bacterium]
MPFSEGRLISTDELATLLAHDSVTVIDARSDLAAYFANHIPGAPYLRFESLRAPRRHPGGHARPRGLCRPAGPAGNTRERPVVIYGTGDAGNFNATFLAWILAGFRHRIYLLDGGYAKWARRTPAHRAYPDTKATAYAVTLRARGGRAGLGALHGESAQRGDRRRAACRPVCRHGEAQGLRRGHIPGAVNHFWQDDLRDAGNGLKVWKSKDELQAGYTRQGITPDKDVFLYCNTGTEASHAYFALRFLPGYEVHVYVPSWTEWAGREDLPIEQGQARRRASSEGRTYAGTATA